jgi:hypothetical protein
VHGTYGQAEKALGGAVSGGLAIDNASALQRASGRHATIGGGDVPLAPSVAAVLIMHAELQSAIKALSLQQSPSEEEADDVAQSSAMADPANATGRAPKSSVAMSSDAMTLERSAILRVDRRARDLIPNEIMMNYPGSTAAVLHYRAVWPGPLKFGDKIRCQPERLVVNTIRP